MHAIQRWPVIFWLLVAATAAGQGPAETVAGAAPPERLLADLRGGFRVESVIAGSAHDGRLWAMGANWKALFDGGVRFWPATVAETSLPLNLALRLAAVSAGGVPVALIDAPAVLEGQDVVIARGALEERYALRLGEIEQLFEIDRPLGGGDLTLEIECKTDLAAQAGDHGIVFSNAAGGVSYSRAVLVDAAGRRTPLATSFAGGRIRITAPAAALEGAAWPVVIDPVIANLTPSAGYVLPVANTDVAFEHGTQRWAVVYELVFNSSDHDVFMRRYDALGIPVTTPGPAAGETLEYTTEDWRDISVAANRLGQNFMTVASRLKDPFPVREIVGRAIGALANAFGPVQVIPSTSGDDNRNPVIGGDPTGYPPTYYCVAFTNSGAVSSVDVRFHMLSSDGVPLPDPDQIVAGSLADEYFPAISKTDGFIGFSYQNWTIAYVDGSTAGDPNIMARRVTWNGVMGPTFGVHTSGLVTTRPCVSSPSQHAPYRYLIGYECELAGGTDVGFALLEGTQILDTQLSLNAIEGGPFVERTRPVVETTGCTFSLAYAKAQSGIGLGSPIGVTTLMPSPDGQVLLVESLTLGGGLSFNSRPRIASSWGGVADERAMVSWNSTVLAGSGVASAALLEIPEEAGAITRVPIATNGLVLQSYGAPQVGQPIAFGLCNHGVSPVLAVGIPAPTTLFCNLPVGVDLSTVTVIPGPFFSAPIPQNPNLIGFAFAVQGADLSGNGCYGYRVSDVLVATIQ
jgi:hypothetical protein